MALPSDPIDPYTGRSGFWVELRDDRERVVYRRIIRSPIANEQEAPSGDPSRPFTRVASESDEGIFAAPEGAACVDAAARLLRSRFLKSTDRIVIYNTGSGLKYPEAYSTRFPMATAGEQDKLGGLITPR